MSKSGIVSKKYADTVWYSTVPYLLIVRGGGTVASNEIPPNSPGDVFKSVLCGPNEHKDYLRFGRGNISLTPSHTEKDNKHEGGMTQSPPPQVISLHATETPAHTPLTSPHSQLLTPSNTPRLTPPLSHSPTTTTKEVIETSPLMQYETSPHATSGDPPTRGGVGHINKPHRPITQTQLPSTPGSHLLQSDTTTPTDNPILALWQHALGTLIPEAITHFFKAQEQAETPPCPDPSGFSDLIHTKISLFTYGE